MTTLVANTYSYLKSGFTVALVSWIIGHLTAVGRAIQASRQTAANEIVARQLLHEYPEHSYESLLAELNRKTLQDIYNG
jgi:hypothetical protein